MDPLPLRRRTLWLSVFAISMGLLEVAVVVYLRELYYPEGFRFPIVLFPTRIAVTELVREATTVAMLLAVAMVAGRDGHDRFFVYAYLFGVWDLVYYAGLEIFLGWPDSVMTWDVLFLLPVPWLAPVLFPMIVACLLVISYVTNEVCRRRGRPLRLSGAEWAVSSAGALLLIVSFCWKWRVVLEERIPDRFPVALYIAALTVAVLPFGRAVRRSLSRTRG